MRLFYALLAVLTVLAVQGCALQENKKEQPQTGGQQGSGVAVINVDGSDPNRKPDHTITVPQLAIKQQAKTNEDTDSKDETPAGVPQADIKAGQEQQKKFAAKDLLPLNLPFAAPSQRGCRTDLVRNYSSRNGVAPREFVVHWTGSANRKGWGDVNAIVAWFNQSRSQASSHYVVDAEGHCAMLVGEANKSWTEAGINPVGISVEVVHPGGPNEPFCPGACRKKVGMIIADASRRWHFPLQHGRTSGCRVIRPGVIDHKSIGICGGGHPDISSAGFSVDPLIAQAKKFLPAAKHRYKPTATDKTTCRKLNWWRTHGRHHGTAERNAIRRRDALAKRGVICTRRGPLKTK